MGIAAHVVRVNVARNKQMKLTKETLKQIIKEEIDAVMNEAGPELSQASRLSGGDAETRRAAASLKPKQYTFADVYDESPTLIIMDERGVVYFANNSSNHPNKTEEIILKQLKPAGYEGIGIIGPNSHLR